MTNGLAVFDHARFVLREQSGTTLLKGQSVAQPASRRDQEKQFATELKMLLEKQVSKAYAIRIGKSLLYKLEVDVDGELRPRLEELRNPKRGQFAFQTDILVEKVDTEIPLVVIELKFGGFSTHDIITYSSKATRHKEIYPYLRYGFVVGGSDALSKKFLTHNQGVDFAMAVPDMATAGSKLIELVKRQIDNAETLVEIMRATRMSFTRYEKNIDVDR